MNVCYTIRTHDGMLVEDNSFDSANTVELYAFLKRAERAIIDGHTVTVVKGED